MGKLIQRAVNAAWTENTILVVVLFALADFFARALGWWRSPSADRASDALYPAFICVVLFMIYQIRSNGMSKLDSVSGELNEIKKKVLEEYSALDSIRGELSDVLKRLDEIKNKVNEQFSYRAFATGPEFDAYLRTRFQEARDVKVIHLSSFATTNKNVGRAYSEILDKFLKKGGTFTRIFSDTGNADVFRWIKEDLKQYQDNKYFIYFLDEIFVNTEMRTMGIMIIDKSEVCLGYGYDTDFANPTMSIKNAAILEFFMDYFNDLSRCAKGIRSQGRPTKWDTLNARITDLQGSVNKDGIDQARN